MLINLAILLYVIFAVHRQIIQMVWPVLLTDDYIIWSTLYLYFTSLLGLSICSRIFAGMLRKAYDIYFFQILLLFVALRILFDGAIGTPNIWQPSIMQMFSGLNVGITCVFFIFVTTNYAWAIYAAFKNYHNVFVVLFSIWVPVTTFIVIFMEQIFIQQLMTFGPQYEGLYPLIPLTMCIGVVGIGSQLSHNFANHDLPYELEV